MTPSSPTLVDCDTPALLAELASRFLSFAPSTFKLRIVGETPDGDAVLPIPLPRGDEDLESRILAVLGTLAKDARMSGEDLARKCDTTRDSGHFKRTIATLKEAGKIDVHKLYGYRLA